VLSPRSGRGPRVERVVGPRLRPRGGPRPRPRSTQLSTRRTHVQHRWTAATVYGPAATARRVQRRPLLCRSRRRFPRPCASSRARRFLRPKAAGDRAGTSRRKRKRRGGRRRPHTACRARRRRPALQPRGTFDSVGPLSGFCEDTTGFCVRASRVVLCSSGVSCNLVSQHHMAVGYHGDVLRARNCCGKLSTRRAKRSKVGVTHDI
jgi:hypothetical protein